MNEPSFTLAGFAACLLMGHVSPERVATAAGFHNLCPRCGGWLEPERVNVDRAVFRRDDRRN